VLGRAGGKAVSSSNSKTARLLKGAGGGQLQWRRKGFSKLLF